MFRSSRYRDVRSRQQPGEQPPRVGAASFLLLGLILGLAGSLLYAWVLSPVVYVDASPARLSQRYHDEYIFLVSQNYAATGDWAQAQRRLDALEDPDLPHEVANLFERYLREGEPAAYVRNLALLTKEVGGENPALALFGPTPLPPRPTASPSPAGSTATATLLPTPTPTRPPTETPRPTITPSRTPAPTATQRPTYRLLSQERVCNEAAPAPRIEVVTVDALLEELPGVAVVVTWEGGSDRFFTGFRPDQGPGYGDFTMENEVSYSVALPEGSPTISGLRVEPCPAAAGGLPGGWRLTFQHLLLNRPTATSTP